MLAGGRSRRFGGVAKGLQLAGGLRIIDRVSSALAAVTTSVVISANDALARDWLDNAVVVSDNRREMGGLAGIEAALAAHGDVLVVAWDMPFVSPALLRLLLDEQQRHDADVVVPESGSPHGIEPFCAFYSARARPALTAFLDAGGGPAHDFLRSIERTHRVPTAAIRAIGDPDRLFFSVNTPDDLARANAWIGTP